ncbi:glycosyltransferase family 4 protein [Roseiarcus fermentans]|nr:glycosyltransferase family 1 protein [Roseiarcus fermentans]
MTGVQRVQIEYARYLLGHRELSVDVFANLHGAHADLAPLFQDPHSLGDEAVFLQIRRLFQLAPPVGFSRRTFADARANGALKVRSATARLRDAVASPMPRFGPSSSLYVGGAFWAHPRSVRIYEQAAKAGCDVVVLYHDVLPIVAPDLANSNCRPLYERMLRLPTRALTVSKHSQAQIERARHAVGAPRNASPVRIVPLAHEFSAAPRNFVPDEAPSPRVAALDRDGEPFVLCVGTIEARKNQLPLLGLWEKLAREMGPGWPRLVVAGKRGWRASEAIRALRRGDPAGPYVWLETPTDAELAFLYARAKFTVFPSLIEGWGLPIGESLWFGKPCVVSNTSSMPEVGGALCSYADPHAIDSFASPIIRLVQDAEFFRSSVAAIRASRLRTWRESAEALFEALTLHEGVRTTSARTADEREAAV